MRCCLSLAERLFKVGSRISRAVIDSVAARESDPVGRDLAAISSKILTFVDAHNSILGDLRTKAF